MKTAAKMRKKAIRATARSKADQSKIFSLKIKNISEAGAGASCYMLAPNPINTRSEGA